MNDPAGAVSRLLVAVRRRLRVAWAVATGQLFAPVLGILLIVLVLMARLRPWTWPEPMALVLGVVAVPVLVGAALLVRVPLPVAARAADRGLDTGDAFTTVLELDAGRLPDGPLSERVRGRAAALASGRRAADAVRLRLEPRRLALSGLLVVLAAGLAVLPNHQDDVRRRRAAEQALTKNEAKALRKAAKTLPATSDGKKSEAAKALEALARQLERSPNLETAKKALDAAVAKLALGLDPAFLSQKAALKGLERALGTRPLPGASGSAAQQLRQSAAQLAGLTPEQRATLADRLAGLAATQTAGNPEAAQALQQAAAAARSGDTGAAATALGSAAAAQDAAEGAVGDQEATAQALGALGTTQSDLAAGPGQPGQGNQSAHGQGQGRGQGKGQGQGSGQGQGQGSGQGQGAGSPSGQVGGSSAAAGGAGGRGGPGTPNGSGHNASVGLQPATVYDPVPGGDGEQINLGGRPGQGPTTAAGRGQGLNRVTGAQVPLERALPRYRSEATRALDSLNLPPSLRALVRAYFDSLGAE